MRNLSFVNIVVLGNPLVILAFYQYTKTVVSRQSISLDACFEIVD